MTYPAINKNMVGHIKGSIITYDEGVQTSYHSSSALHPQVLETRPATRTSGVSASNWRPPLPWSHSGSYCSLNPLQSFEIHDRRQSYNTYTAYNDGAGWNNTVFGMPSFPGNLEGPAVNQALLNLKSQRVNLAQAFAERKETANLAIDAAQKCVNLIDSFLTRHGRLHSRRALMSLTVQRIKRIPRYRNTKGLLNDFLQVQYGVRPLMQDVYGSCEALEQRERDADAYRVSVKGSRKSITTVNWKKQSDYTSDIYFPVQFSVEHRCFVRLDYVLDNPFLATLASAGVTNPASLAWERVPLSFVADWFLPVGDYLSAMDADFGWRFIGGSSSKISRINGQSDMVVMKQPSGNPYLFYVKVGSAQYVERRYRFVRDIFSSSPWPRIPSFKNPLSGQHIANAIALVFSRLRQ